MSEDEKKELIVALDGYTPYGVICRDTSYQAVAIFEALGINKESVCCKEFYRWDIKYDSVPIEYCKPYLRSLSSMSKVEMLELYHAFGFGYDCIVEYTEEWERFTSSIKLGKIFIPYPIWNDDILKGFEWLNKYHFDYRRLIERGLAIEVTKDNNPYKP